MQLSNSLTPRSISSSGYLLRQYGGAAAAYSLQRLDTSTENVVRAREGVGDTEADFTAEEVSGGALREFALQNDADLIRFADQAVAADKRMYFDGVNDNVTFADNAVFDLTTYVDIRFKFFITATAVNQCLISKGAGAASNYVIDISGGNFRFFGYDGSSVLHGHIGAGFSPALNTVYDIQATFDGNDWTVIANGSTVISTTDTATLATNSSVFAVGSRAGAANFLNGSVWDVEIYDNLAAQTFGANGYGNTNGDWEDQIGSNDGTVVGSPALFSGQGFDAFVTTWYDQSGNGRNATQATAASQPQIVADGVVVTDDSGVPAMDFDGSNDYFSFSITPAPVQPNSIFFVHESDTVTASSNEFFDSLAGSRTLVDQLGSDYRLYAGSVAGSGLAIDTNPTIVSCIFNGASSLLFKNGESSGTINAGTDGLGYINSIGLSNAASAYYNGKMSEFVIYPTDENANRAAIEANIASRYGITLA